MSLSCNRIIIFSWLKVVFLFWIIPVFGALWFLLLMTKTSTSSPDMFLIYLQKGHKRLLSLKPHFKNYLGFFFWRHDSGRGVIGCLEGIGDARSNLIERDWLTDVFPWRCISQAPTRLLSQPSSRIAPSRRGSASKKPTNSHWGRWGLHRICHLLSTLPSLLSVSSL